MTRKPAPELKPVEQNQRAGEPAGTEELPGVVQLPDGHGPHPHVFKRHSVVQCLELRPSTVGP